MQFQQLTIVGVGLIGASVGLAARARQVVGKIVGVGRDERTLARAQAMGCIDAYSTKLPESVEAADLVIVCTPVDRIAADVRTVASAAPNRCVITDVGSTKGGIIRELSQTLPAGRAMFVGSHPLAGSEKKGAAHARVDLLTDRVVIVTPTTDTDLEAASVVELFWQLLGARVVRMDPFEHDQALAMTSHLPHLASAALAGVTPAAWLSLTAGGYRDTTRIAAGDPELWTAIFEANKEAVLAALDRYTARIAEFRRAMQAGDRQEIHRWLTDGKRVRDALGS